MSIQDWSDNIRVLELSDDPQFSDDVGGLLETYGEKPTDVVLSFAAVGFINSSNIARLLRLRKLVTGTHHRLLLCGVASSVWGVLQVTGLDKIFEFTNDMATSLAMLQMAASPAAAPRKKKK